MENILIIAAHPDDEVLGCGGTIANLTRKGSRVSVALLGEGISSRYNKRDSADEGLTDKLAFHSRKAAEILGVDHIFQHKLPDNRFDTVPLLDIVKWIEKLIEKLSPKVIYTQHGGDLNIDHLITFRATLTAARPLPGSSISTIYAYEVGSSTDWAFQQFYPSFRPNTFFDISDTLELKIKAMELYQSELRDFPHPRSPEAISYAARRWGSIAGLNAAEAFELIRHVE
ncbi:MAG: PIG-L family deacetylase [candidate division Zixibacteria bacterium]|nr:PIG-L family deacetylase [Candidatus Tariuqbacter arcticus]